MTIAEVPSPSLEPAEPVKQVRALTRATDGLGEVQGWQLSDSQVRASLVAVEQAVRALALFQVTLLAAATKRGLPGRDGHRQASHWLTTLVPGLEDVAARRMQARSEMLFTSPLAAEMTPTLDAVRSGAVSLAQADVVGETVAALVPPTVPAGTVDDDTLVEAQLLLLQQAASTDPRRLRRYATSLRHRLDPGADDRLAGDEGARERARTFTLASLPSRMVHVSGLLTPECGAALRTAIDAWSAPRPAVDGTRDVRTASQRRHDALQQLASSALADPSRLPSTHGSAYRVVVTVPHDTLAAALEHGRLDAASPARLADDTELSSSALRRISCDAELVPVVLDDVGNPLDVGDTQYAFPPRQCTAITARDEHCTYPGCTAPPAWCDIHHLESYDSGGPTAVSNGALLCGHHHRHVHATGQRGRLVEGRVQWPAVGRGRGAVNRAAVNRAADSAAVDGAAAAALTATSATRAARALDHLVRRWRARQQQ